MDDLTTLLLEVRRIAKRETDGHFSIFKFTTEYKACLGTPDLSSGNGRKEVNLLKGYLTLHEALASIVKESGSLHI